MIELALCGVYSVALHSLKNDNLKFQISAIALNLSSVGLNASFCISIRLSL
jgi:hypothetical protein